ncbi:hypothetical protein KIPB_009254, partial [Kipferlia bialata]|eukprot:g9254.t1
MSLPIPESSVCGVPAGSYAANPVKQCSGSAPQGSALTATAAVPPGAEGALGCLLSLASLAEEIDLPMASSVPAPPGSAITHSSANGCMVSNTSAGGLTVTSTSTATSTGRPRKTAPKELTHKADLSKSEVCLVVLFREWYTSNSGKKGAHAAKILKEWIGPNRAGLIMSATLMKDTHINAKKNSPWYKHLLLAVQTHLLSKGVVSEYTEQYAVLLTLLLRTRIKIVANVRLAWPALDERSVEIIRSMFRDIDR